MKVSLFRYVFLLFLSPLYVCSQTLIPEPKHLEHISEEFAFGKGFRIEGINLEQHQDEQLVRALEEMRIPINGRASQVVLLKKVGREPYLQACTRLFNLSAKVAENEEAYLLQVSKDTVSVMAETEAGIYYGVQTLKQLFRAGRSEKVLPGLKIFDKPDIAIRAWQDDISRGPIPTLETLKKEIELLSSFKLNYFTLYTEQVFKLKKHPGIAPEDGISTEDLQELADFAKAHFVTLIGNYQSFGHMGRTLKIPAYQHLAENKDIISPAVPETYDFLGDVYAEMVPQYAGEFFNINCDETFGLGEGKSKAMVDSIGLEGVYAYHINRLDGILKKYKKKILMWGDIAVSHPKIIPQLPKDITVIAWAYQAADNFDSYVAPLVDEGLQVWVAPGVSCWSSVYPNLQVSQKNIYNFIRDGHKLGAQGVLNTSWDDDGLNFFNNNWYGFIWGAENCWNAPPALDKEESDHVLHTRLARFNLAFDKQFFGLRAGQSSATKLMLDFANLHSGNLRDALRNYRFLEPIFPLYHDYVQKGEKEKNESILQDLERMSERLKQAKSEVQAHALSLDYLDFAIEQAKYIVKKNLFRIDLKAFIDQLPGAKSKAQIKQDLANLKNELKKFEQNYANLWRKENRNYWLDENEQKFEKLLKSYAEIEGEVNIIPTDEVDSRGRKIVIRSIFNDFPVYYSLNADTVNTDSHLYTQPFYIQEDTKILAKSIAEDRDFPMKQEDLIQHKAIGKLYKLNTAYSTYLPAYDGGGKTGLIDGRVGAESNIKSGFWQGYGGDDIDIELDFKSIQSLNRFSMGFYQNTLSWVIFPPTVQIFLKDKETEAYKLFTEIKGKTAPEVPGALKELYKADLKGVKARYMRVVAKNYGHLPEWHPAGSTYESMLFSDEIIVK
ncbi:family 20 glycosylhydrolase [Marinilongibacter aquaticus]|uniref:glycoside hydrolase family 20 zincin-like fold domain-containing protein n=1 Tax=Marinilongibacter aquaticus TaxID=2975157 RepID=UPI0021BDA125|nr:glycoside hydrolase family 20 zincin-like fold domain-containing protein [Marinilongibacter aquaticus]UBM59664.1 family 20 glycosylhydrolase [Marinilongibacter aquaticus]